MKALISLMKLFIIKKRIFFLRININLLSIVL